MEYLDLLLESTSFNFLDIYEEIRNFSIDDDPFMESKEITNESVSNKVVEFLKNIIEKIKEVVNKVKISILKFLDSVEMKLKIRKYAERAKTDKKFANTKVKLKDYNNLDKMNAHIQEEIRNYKNAEECEAAMKKYRKQRNIAIAGGIVSTVTVATVLAFIIKGHKDKINNLEVSNAKNIRHIEKLKEIVVKKNGKINQLKTDLKDTTLKLDKAKAKSPRAKMRANVNIAKNVVSKPINKMNKEIAGVKAQASIIAEVTSNSTKDITNEVKESLQVLADADKNTATKIKEVATNVSSIKDSVRKVTSGEAKIDAGMDKREELKQQVSSLKDKKERALKVAGNKYATPEQNDRITSFYYAYRKLGGNHEVESLYEDHYLKLPVHEDRRVSNQNNIKKFKKKKKMK